MGIVKAWFTLSMLAAVVLGSFATGAAVTRIIKLSQPVPDAVPAIELQGASSPASDSGAVGEEDVKVRRVAGVRGDG